MSRTALRDEMRRYNAEHAFEEAMRRHGVEPRLIETSVNDDTIVYTHSGDITQGRAMRSITIGGAFDGERIVPHAHRELDRSADELARLARRRHALLGLGLDAIHPPAWACVVHPLAAAFMTGDGLDPLDLVRTDPDEAMGQQGMRTLACGGTTTEDEPRERRRGVLQGMTGTLLRRSSGGPTTYYDGGGYAVIILDRPLPQTVLTALPGRRLEDVVDHPGIAGLDLHVTVTTQNSAGLQFISVEDRLVTLADAPAGVDTSWLWPGVATDRARDRWEAGIE